MVKGYKEYFFKNDLDDIRNQIYLILKEYELRETKYILNPGIYSALIYLNQDVFEKSIQVLESESSIYDEEEINFLAWDNLTWALIMLSLLPNLKEEYHRHSIDLNIFYGTISDLIFRISRYFRDNGELGLYFDDRNWLMRIFYLKIFKLSSLQFEILNNLNFIRNKEITGLIKDTLVKGSKYLAIHIMEGEDICPDTIEKALGMADNFFDKDYKFFICYSWLLFEGMQEILEEDSNISNFQRRFDILINFEDNRDAIRAIFSRKQERETRMQKRAKNNLKSLGMGFGIINRKSIK